jgi:integrase
MPQVATKLMPTAKGGFMARKVIPPDVRDAFGGKVEERFVTGPMTILRARAEHREWSSDIESRIANARALRKGEGRSFTPKEMRALAAEWYGWFIARNPQVPPDVLCSELYGAAMACGMFQGDPMDLWEVDSRMRERVRPLIADEAKPNQFLAAKRLVLDAASRDMFLDYVTRDFFAAVALLARREHGDEGPDKYAEQFPPIGQVSADPSLTPWALFERWIADAKPADSTVNRWRGVFLKLQADFPNQGAAALLPEQMQTWAEGLINSERAPVTVHRIWLLACRTVFAFAVGKKLIGRNPFIGWNVTVPKKIRTRETKAFTELEIDTILHAASAIDVRSKGGAAKRWCPWLAAYSGARMGELTQLRGVDIDIARHAMTITPEAGTVKTKETRTVPLHDHLIEQGFLDYVKANGNGPLFCTEPDGAVRAGTATKRVKARAVTAREHLATWVRSLGVNDPELSPNHAWRHTFKAIGSRCQISDKTLDFIVGHAPATVGNKYGEPTLDDKTHELRKFPRYAAAENL